MIKKIVYLAVLVTVLVSCNGKKNKTVENIVTEDTVVVVPVTLYGIVIDSLDIEHKTVKRHEFLGTILDREGVVRSTR